MQLFRKPGAMLVKNQNQRLEGFAPNLFSSLFYYINFSQKSKMEILFFGIKKSFILFAQLE
ncbi:hypothetical protein C0971_13755 [Bacillus methanolicus]|nr:hypothetical protein C0971_13755 [Bacillus methanolicus]